jgi:hypothetical protein
VIESLQWSADEDAKSKQQDIDKLRRELAIVHRSKEDALDLQRADLTATFEQLMQQREESFLHREDDIHLQITALDQRFEKLQNENLRLKEALRESRSQVERMDEVQSQKEDRLRQLQYQLEDEAQSRIAAEDLLKRQINALQLESQRLNDARAKDKLDWESLCDQVSFSFSLFIYI